AGVSERGLRTWFDKELITETGIRNTVFRNEASGRTGSMLNVAVDALVRRFLLRTELRGGGAWVELVHDRFVEPIRASNGVWFPLHLSALQRQAVLWDEQGRSSGLLLRDEALVEAEAWAADHADDLASHEQEFLAACREAHEAAERERRQSRRIRMLAIAAMAITILAIGAAVFAFTKTHEARENAKLAEDRIAQVGQMVGDLGMARLLSMASELDKAGDRNGAVTLLQTVIDLNPALLADLDDDTLSTDSYELLESVSWHDENGGEYAYIPAGSFLMGLDVTNPIAYGDEQPKHLVNSPGFWIGRTEVTNEQYGRCIAARVCSPPDGSTGLRNDEWNKRGFEKHPVKVLWPQAVSYAKWVGGHLPTEAEWEKACRGPEGSIYPWGDDAPSKEWLDFQGDSPAGQNEVGIYPATSYGLFDMAGNAAEWTNSLYAPYPYTADDGQEDLTEPGQRRVIRGGGGSLGNFFCAGRSDWSGTATLVGFRVVASLTESAE
ncbi:MAG: SUMF1/EgtB/PvdO family nonheme iron enzyme, partial [Anaerolineae bacterium]|nr:SUMF1/EgtB/PvdO family nonheme iron enzyme [Anaerolineae bacterium]